MFAPLRKNAAAFAKVKVGDWGWCAHWSDEMEISADTLWRLALEQGGARQHSADMAQTGKRL